MSEGAPSTPYPSTLDVSGMGGAIQKATVTLTGPAFSSADLDVALVSPAGQAVMLTSDVSNEGSDTPGANWTFDDGAEGDQPINAPTGTYRPTNDPGTSGNSDVFAAPAPPPPYASALSALAGEDANGTWKLYAFEGSGLMEQARVSIDALNQINGWVLNLTTAGAPPAQTPPPTEPSGPVVEPPAPQPTGPTESGSPDIKILAASFDGASAGHAGYLDITASDANDQISGLIVDFGENLGTFGESACVEGVDTGGTSNFHVPYAFLTPGSHTVAVTVFAGGCGSAIAHTYVFTVQVAASTAARAARRTVAHQSTTLKGPKITSKCPNKSLLPTPANAKRITVAILCIVNEQRTLHHLKPLARGARLAKAAAAHTKAMVTRLFFAHQGPKELALAARLKRVKYRGPAGENIAAGAGTLGTPVAIVNGWMHSKLHRANVLHPKWKFVGIAFQARFPIRTSARPVGTYTADFGIRP